MGLAETSQAPETVIQGNPQPADARERRGHPMKLMIFWLLLEYMLDEDEEP
jgi:hypothetical protein